MPETFTLHVKEGHCDITDHSWRQDNGAVEIEQVAKVGCEFDQVVCDLTLLKLIEHGKEK